MSSEEYPNINLGDVSVTQLCKSTRSGWALDVIVGIKVNHLPTGLSAFSTTFENAHKDRHAALKELDRKVGLLKNGMGPGRIVSTPKLGRIESSDIVINFVDFCIEKEKIDKNTIELAFLHWLRESGDL